jgi:hypothetical protein
MCPNGAKPTLTTFKDPKMGNNDIGFGKGINGTFKCPSTALFSYGLTGTATTSWTYPQCKTGFTRKLSGKPHPNYYTCFQE